MQLSCSQQVSSLQEALFRRGQRRDTKAVMSLTAVMASAAFMDKKGFLVSSVYNDKSHLAKELSNQNYLNDS